MSRRNKSRDFTAFILSAALHTGLVIALAAMPKQAKRNFDTVALEVESSAPSTPVDEPERLEEPEPNPEPEPEPTLKALKREKQPKKQEPNEPPPDEPPPLEPPDAPKETKEAEEAPPVFDLGDNSFAAGAGQGASWSLRRSEGNTKFAAVARKDQQSVRNTAPRGSPNGKSGGTGKVYAPVPLKDLSERPKPKYGSIAIPPYPDEARREGIEGAVVLQVFIDKTGRVRRARVIKDPGGGLGEVARIAMLREIWTPPLDRHGSPVDTVIIYSYRFVLDG